MDELSSLNAVVRRGTLRFAYEQEMQIGLVDVFVSVNVAVKFCGISGLPSCVQRTRSGKRVRRMTFNKIRISIGVTTLSGAPFTCTAVHEFAGGRNLTFQP